MPSPLHGQIPDPCQIEYLEAEELRREKLAQGTEATGKVIVKGRSWGAIGSGGSSYQNSNMKSCLKTNGTIQKVVNQ
jgi:hypothetical protein